MIRTRFAPSPTGYLHIGGVRTALFNWLFARKHGGQFLLRIDDTDAQRNVEEALAPILHGFRWLGIDWDEGPEVGGPYAPYYQSQRMDNYRAAAAKLVAAGFAYYDYATTEEIQAEREAAEREKRQFTYSRRWMAETDADRQRFEREGRAAVVRLKMPREGTLVLDDLVRGRVEFDWAREQDHVVQRADGTCLYHLASVVDDFDFQISHVIRAEEHLSNTPRQVFIAQGLGYPRPQYAHLPYVAEPGSRNKLSKRKLDKYLKNADFAKVNEHGQRIAAALGLATSAETFNPVIVDFYEQVGYLPDAIVNYLLLLGWSLDDKTEDFSRSEMIAAFSLDRVNKAPASFDPAKLAAFQERHMQRLPAKQKVAFVLPFLQRAGIVSSPPPCDIGPKLLALVDAAGDRIKVAGDILEYADFLAPADKLEYDEKALEKRIAKPPEAMPLLKKFREVLAATEPFDAPTLDRALHQFVEREQIQIGQIIHAIRVAVTGKAVGFGLFETLALLGRECSLNRIEQTLDRIESPAPSPQPPAAILPPSAAP
ncbi:MAG: glutamate--tRNA ligase [Planctomycetota bacterium]|nr:MAG: glutamate--tRNA ligase [Planctomycetota bacterium]